MKQSAALCLLHLLRASADAIPMSEWSSRIIHLLNDQHMVSILKVHSVTVLIEPAKYAHNFSRLLLFRILNFEKDSSQPIISTSTGLICRIGRISDVW